MKLVTFTHNDDTRVGIVTGDEIIDTTNHSVVVTMPYETDLTSFAPTIAISEGALISPESGVERDFTNAVIYTVTAEDGTTTQDWVIAVSATHQLQPIVTGIEPSSAIPGSEITIYGNDFAMYKIYRSTDPFFNSIKTVT